MTQKGFEKQTGQSLSEYTLTLSLVALVSLGGLMLMGDSLIGFLKQITGLVMHQDTSSPSSIPTSEAPSSNTVKAPSSASTPVQFSYNAATGMISMENLDTGTSGKITTSSQGTELAGLAMRRLAQEATTNDGQPAEPDVSNLLNKLADLMHTMALQESTITLPPSTDTSSKAYNEYYKASITSSLTDFNNTYIELNNLIGKDPKYTQLMEKANTYTGIASSIALYNYVTQYRSDLTSEQIKNVVIGTDITTQAITAEFHPDDVTAAAEAMSKLATTQ